MWRRTSGGDDRGFTVAEIVAASAILFVVVGSVATGLVAASASSASAARRETALNVANQQLEEMRNINYDDLGVVGGDPAGTIPATKTVNGFTVTTDVDWVRDKSTGRATYKTVKLTLSWTVPRPGEIEVESNVFGSSALANTGDISIMCLDSETNGPVKDVNITVTPSTGSPRSKLSDATGEAFFGYAPSGAFSFTASSSDYIFDLTGISSSDLISDTIARLTIYGYKASKAVVAVVGTSGSPISGATVNLTDSKGAVHTATTGADGTVTIGGLDKGDCTVNVTATGRSPGVAMLTIPAGGGHTVNASVTLNDPAALRVRVTDSSTGNPLPGASVEVRGPAPANPPVAGSPKVTSASGEASFDTIIDPGDYTATVTMDGYAIGTGMITLAPAENKDLAIQLTPAVSGAISVSLRDRRGNALYAVREIRITPSDGRPSWKFTTDSSGRAYLTDLQAGQYRLKGTRWYDTWTTTANVVVGRTEIVVVTVYN